MKNVRHRILLADDHRMFAQGLGSVLGSEFELVGTVTNGTELLEAAERLHPDVVVTDLDMPSMDGLQATRALASVLPSTRVIILTMHASSAYATEALRNGARAYVLKSSPVDELTSAIELVMEGRVYVTPEIAQQVMSRVVEKGDEPEVELTPRQRQVVALTAAGASMKQVALRLGISRRTVEYHKYRAMEVLGVDSLAELVLAAARMGLVDQASREKYGS